MSSFDYSKYIREVPDFPVNGISFKDIGPLLSEPKAFRVAVSEMESMAAHRVPDVIISPDARGWLFAAPIAYTLGIPLHMARKPNKLPPETTAIEYDYEYANGELHISADHDYTNQHVLIMDDVNATGGTALALTELVRQQGAENVSYICFINIMIAGGKELLREHDVNFGSVLNYGQ